MALPAYPPYPNALQTSRITAADGGVYYVAKTGLVWTGAELIEVEVPEELKGTLAVGWGRPTEQVLAVRVDCPTSGEWLAMPGGYWVTRPICAELIVRVAGREQRVRIGLGTPCDGQDEPAGPSDDVTAGDPSLDGGATVTGTSTPES